VAKVRKDSIFRPYIFAKLSLRYWRNFRCRNTTHNPICSIQKIKSQFINSVQPRLKNSRLISKDVTLHFCRHNNVQSNVVAGNVIPLITDVSVDDDDAVSVGGFDFVTYRRSLQTSVLGNTMMFSEIVTTTMTLFDGYVLSLMLPWHYLSGRYSCSSQYWVLFIYLFHRTISTLKKFVLDYDLLILWGGVDF